MAQASDIEWTDATWTIVQGCDYESPGCTNCYAVRVVWRLAHNPNSKISEPLQGLVEKRNGNLIWTGKVAMRHDRLDWPAKWKSPLRIFVPSHGDLFHEGVAVDFISEVLAQAAMTSRHTYQILTKRDERMRQLMSDPDFEMMVRDLVKYESCAETMKWPLENVWLGVSVEDQTRADQRIPNLLNTPAAVRFLSCEPLLGHVHLGYLNWPNGAGLRRTGHNALIGARYENGEMVERLPKIDWVICGGESGPRKRPTDVAWHRSLRDQCAAAGTPFFEKQIDKVQPIPADLLIREFPVP